MPDHSRNRPRVTPTVSIEMKKALDARSAGELTRFLQFCEPLYFENGHAKEELEKLEHLQLRVTTKINELRERILLEDPGLDLLRRDFVAYLQKCKEVPSRDQLRGWFDARLGQAVALGKPVSTGDGLEKLLFPRGTPQWGR